MFVEKTVRDVIVFQEAQHAAPFPAAQPKERCNLELHEIPETLFVWFVIFVVEKDFVRPNNIPRELQKEDGRSMLRSYASSRIYTLSSADGDRYSRIAGKYGPLARWRGRKALNCRDRIGRLA